MVAAVAESSPTRLRPIGYLAERLGISPSRAWRLVRDDPRAPRPIKVGQWSTRFREDAIAAYIYVLTEDAEKRVKAVARA